MLFEKFTVFLISSWGGGGGGGVVNKSLDMVWGGLLNFDIEWRGGFAKNYKSTFKFCQPPLCSNK